MTDLFNDLAAEPELTRQGIEKYRQWAPTYFDALHRCDELRHIGYQADFVPINGGRFDGGYEVRVLTPQPAPDEPEPPIPAT